MDRRHFLANSGVLVAGSALAGCSSRVVGCGERLAGVQLFTVREALTADVGRTLAALAGNGIQEIELFGLTAQPSIFGLPPADFRALLDHSGIALSFSHISGDDFDIPAISRVARSLGIGTIVLAVAPGMIQVGRAGLRVAGPEDLAELDRLIDLLNDMGEAFAGEGLEFAYHNHHVEFRPVDGVLAYDYMMSRTNPERVKLELDIGWLALAGVDPVDYLERYGERVIACHLKDFVGGPPFAPDDFSAAASQLAAPGTGLVDFPAVLAAMNAIGIGHGFVEIDSVGDPMAAVASGTRYLTSLSGC
jgi:sugar phosphate isomerase/epimerase